MGSQRSALRLVEYGLVTIGSGPGNARSLRPTALGLHWVDLPRRWRIEIRHGYATPIDPATGLRWYARRPGWVAPAWVAPAWAVAARKRRSCRLLVTADSDLKAIAARRGCGCADGHEASTRIGLTQGTPVTCCGHHGPGSASA